LSGPKLQSLLALFLAIIIQPPVKLDRDGTDPRFHRCNGRVPVMENRILRGREVGEQRGEIQLTLATENELRPFRDERVGFEMRQRFGTAKIEQFHQPAASVKLAGIGRVDGDS